MVYEWLKKVQSTVASGLFPGHCALCGDRAHSLLCPPCTDTLPANQPACPRCALHLPGDDAAHARQIPTPCGACVQHPPAFDRAISAWQYAGAVPHLIITLKFHQGLHLIRPLADGLLSAVQARTRRTLPEVILPVPLHPSRLRQRGFNQALELARPLARALELPIAHTLCTRQRVTAVQSTLALRQRRANVRGAFAITGPCPWRHVALLDDVLTSGYTVGELSRVLKQAGADYVEVWTVARASPRP